MRTDCTRQIHIYQGQKGEKRTRRVEGAFDGGAVTTDGGAILLREVEQKQRILRPGRDGE